MLETRPVEYLGMQPPVFGVPGNNATFAMTENCGVVMKDCARPYPLSGIAIAELEELLSHLFECDVKIVTKKRTPRLLGTYNPEGEG